MNIPYIINNKGLTFYVNGVPVLIESSDIRYGDILKLINNPSAENEQKIHSILKETQQSFTIAKTIKTVGKFNDFSFFEENGEINLKYKNYPITGYLAKKLTELFVSGCKDFSHFSKFVEKLYSNPSETSRKELYYFLEFQSLPITQEGNFIAYKGVGGSGYSIHGNKKTRVIQGKVDSDGRILNQPGAVIEVYRDDVSDNRELGCAQGLHVGSFAYAGSFANALLAVEVNPKDVVSVPSDCNNQKCRVCKYKVLNFIEEKINTPDVIVKNTDITVPERKTVVEENNSVKTKMLSPVNRARISLAIARNIKNHGGQTTISQLCGSVGRPFSGCTAPIMVAVCCDLGYNITPDTSNPSACGKMAVS